MKTASYVNLMGVLVLITVVFGWTTEHFFTVRTFQTIANQLPALIVVAVGMTFVLGIAGIDLSVGSVLALGSSVLGVLLVDAGAPLWVGMAASLGVGLLCGLASGYVAVRWSIPSFIVTLGMLEIARGAAYLVTGSQTKYIGAAVSGLGEPLPFIGLSAAFLVALLVAAGVDIRKVQIAVFALAGLLSGLGGVFQTAYLGSADPNAGTGMELAAIAAVVIGGTSLMGGRASVINSFLGVLIIAFLQSGLAQVGASDPTKRVVTGAVIIAAVLVDVFRQKRRAGPSV